MCGRPGKAMRNRQQVVEPHETGHSFFNLVTEKPPAVVIALLFAYLIIYRIATPPISALILDSGAEHIGLRAISNSILQLSLFFPIIFMRRVGIFHPLAFPTLFGVAFDAIFQPLHLALPFIISFKPFLEMSTSYSIYMSALPPTEYSLLNVKSDLVHSFFLIFTYAGFALASSLKVPTFGRKFPANANYTFAAKLYLLCTITLATAFIIGRGGVESQIVSFYQGRYETLAGWGAIFAPVKTAAVALMLWIAVASRLGKDFWLALMVLAPLYWLVDGSRSSLLILILSCLVVYAMKRRRIPTKMILASGAFAFVAFGFLGIIRQDFRADSVDLSAISEAGIVDAIAASQKETSKRSAEEADLAAILTADEHSGRLWGRSYLAVVAYPIPRAIWEEKPKNIYTYVNWVAFQGNSADSFAPQTWGIPIEASTEAYWNFGHLGVCGVALMVGLMLGCIFRSFKLNPQSPILLIIYIQSLLYLTGDSRMALYFVQNVCAALIMTAIAVIAASKAHNSPARSSILK